MAPKLMKSYSGGAMTMSRALLALLVTAAAGAGPPSHRASTPFRPQAGLCKACHQNVFASFVQTAHFHTSAEATTQSVRGRFSGGHNLLRTSSEGLYFKMERRDAALLSDWHRCVDQQPRLYGWPDRLWATHRPALPGMPHHVVHPANGPRCGEIRPRLCVGDLL